MNKKPICKQLHKKVGLLLTYSYQISKKTIQISHVGSNVLIFGESFVLMYMESKNASSAYVTFSTQNKNFGEEGTSLSLKK